MLVVWLPESSEISMNEKNTNSKTVPFGEQSERYVDAITLGMKRGQLANLGRANATLDAIGPLIGGAPVANVASSCIPISEHIARYEKALSARGATLRYAKRQAAIVRRICLHVPVR